MIERVFANRGSFKAVGFREHFNVVLAERSEGSRAKDSRNGSGKTSLLEVIHFCLGANADAGHPLLNPALTGWRFGLEFTARGSKIVAERSAEQPSRVYLRGLPPAAPVVRRTSAEDDAEQWLPNDEWRGPALGWLGFDITPEEAAEPGAPTARGSHSYFARRGRDAFSDPFTVFRTQPASQRQVLNAFLLGLDWRYPARAQELRDKDRSPRQGAESPGGSIDR